MKHAEAVRLLASVSAPLLVAALACSNKTPEAPPPELPSPGADGVYDVRLPEPKPVEARSIRLALGADLKRCDVEDPHFPYDESVAKPSAIPELKHLAACLKTDPFADVDLRLVGRADPRGGVEYNEKLAKERALYVRDKLVEYGVSPSRIQVAARGEAGALGDTDQASYGYDRRVDIVQLQVIHP